MNRYHVTVLLALVVLAGIVLVPVAFADSHDESDDVAPGERLMGSIGAQDAELTSEVDERAFGEAIATAAAEGDTSKLADLIQERTQRNEQQLDNLTERLEELDQKLENGTISKGQYNAEIAKLEVQRQSIVRTSEQAANAANGLPADVLVDRGINVTAIERLKANASEFGGQELREVAKSIAGPDVGNASPQRPSMGDRMVNQVTRFDEPNRTLDRASHWIDHAERVIDRVTQRAELLNGSDRGPPGQVDEEVWTKLDAASEELEAAKQALANATEALADGDEATAREYAKLAAEHATAATDFATEAADELRGMQGSGNQEPPDTGPPQ